MEEPIALDIAIDQIPHHREKHDDQRHLTIALEQEREDEGTLEIVKLENQEEDQIWQLELHVRNSPQIEHYHKHRHLHETPTHLIINSGPPLVGTHLTITRIHKIQCHKHD
jgi:hypothetical protein